MVPASLADRFVIRFCVCAQGSTEEDIKYAYNVISEFSSDLLEIMKIEQTKKAGQLVSRKNARSLVAREPSVASPESTTAVPTEEQVEEEESVDEVVVLDRKKKMSLRYKRSFFVRMVSDPKLYNPKIVKALGSRSSSGGGGATDGGTIDGVAVASADTPVDPDVLSPM